jgi:hypothetical protein
VISGAILAAAALLGSYLLNWWPTIGRYAALGFEFARETSIVPNWLIALLLLLAAPTVLFVLALIWQIAFPSKSSTSSWHEYTSDNFFGLCWRWRYIGERLSEMHTFCPHCDFQVFPENASAYAAIDRISFHCDSCNRDLGTFEEPYGSLENKAGRFAQQKLRQGTWQSQNGA